MSGGDPGDRSGLTLLELLVVMLTLAILAGIALPSLRRSIFDAQAAHIVTDANTIRLAAFTHLGDTGRFPSTGGFGVAPADLEPYLPEDFTFSYGADVSYAWFSLRLRNADNVWNTRNLGILLIRYPRGGGIAAAMQAHSGPSAYWSPSLFYFVYAG